MGAVGRRSRSLRGGSESPGLRWAVVATLLEPNNLAPTLSQHVFSPWLNSVELPPGHLFR